MDFDTTLMFQPSEPFFERQAALNEKCIICNKNINSNCTVHKQNCQYSCHYDSQIIPIGDMFSPLFIVMLIYFLFKKYLK
jgi:hypothetical protein